MKNLYNILLLSMIFGVQLHADIDFDAFADQFFAHTNKHKIVSLPQWHLFNTSLKEPEHLVFTAIDMHKNSTCPDTSFNNIYTTKNVSLQAWKMLPSNKPQQEISLLFGIPDDYNASQNSTITLFLLVQGNEDTGTANIEIALDSKATRQLLGPDFVAAVSTGNFVVTKPAEAKDLTVLTVQATIPASTIAPKSLLALTFSRIAPTDDKEEYKQNIYLESIVISYTKNDI